MEYAGILVAAGVTKGTSEEAAEAPCESRRPSDLYAERVRRLHAVLAVVWLLLALPAVLWWSESVTFVVFGSVYANVAGHLAGYQGARAERAASS